MAFKMNPMRSERVCSLGRKLSNIPANFSDTFSGQWLSLDDSAIRRMDIPEVFILSDTLLLGLDDVTNGRVVFPANIESQLEQELPFMATENIIMKLVSHGVSRQEAHEQIRVLSLEAVKLEGKKNGLLDAKLFIGRSAEIVERYAGQLTKCKDYISSTATATLTVFSNLCDWVAEP